MNYLRTLFACIAGSVDVKTLITSIDAQCPQIAPFGVMRCLGHQHIGKSMTKLYAAHGRDQFHGKSTLTMSGLQMTLPCSNLILE